MDDNSLIKVSDSPTREDDLLDLLLRNRCVKDKVCPACSDQSGVDNFEKSKQNK